MKPTYAELLEVIYYLSNQIIISENQTKIEYFELPMKDAVRATVEYAVLKLCPIIMKVYSNVRFKNNPYPNA